MLTVIDIIKKTADFLTAKGVESARFNAETLVGHALGLSRMKLYLQFERVLTEQELVVIRPMVRRRGQREPLQYIIGHVDFSGITLKVDKRALIPRPETEYLIEKIKARFAENNSNSILDLGTGTGAIALALAHHFPNAHVTALDVSTDALDLARENAHTLNLHARLEFNESSWFSALQSGRQFNLIISNPPYLTTREVEQASLEVNKFEPLSALVSEDEGLLHITHIITHAKSRLLPGGLLALETGESQHAAIELLSEILGYSKFESCNDLAGKSRYAFMAV